MGTVNHMKDLYDAARHLVWLTQFGLSVVLPPVLFLLGAVWLRKQFGLGGWVILVGFALGMVAAIGSLRYGYRLRRRRAAHNGQHDDQHDDDDAGHYNHTPFRFRVHVRLLE